ncbi:MAG: hypothetical protein GX967_01230 [Clostridiales bacterium]|mgnify:CR=1 FL=1|nr:hypothetical protein [Clostridiales bacterium]
MNIANLLSANMITADSNLASIKGGEVASGDFTALLMNMINTDVKLAMNSENIIMQILQMLSSGASSEECLNLLSDVDIEVLEEVADLIGGIATTKENITTSGAKFEDADEKAEDDDITEEMQQLASTIMPAHIPDIVSAVEMESDSSRIDNANILNTMMAADDGEQLPRRINIDELANVVGKETFVEVSDAIRNAIANKTTGEASPVQDGIELDNGERISADKSSDKGAHVEITKVDQDRTAQIFERSIIELRRVVVKSEEIDELHKIDHITNASGVEAISTIANADINAIEAENAVEVIRSEPIEQVAIRISNQMAEVEKEGTTKIEMRLEPESLGKVVIEMTIESGKLAVKIVAENQMASAMLAERASDLTHGLKGQGITLESYDVSYTGHESGDSHHRDQQFRQGRNTFTMNGNYSSDANSDYVNTPSSALNLYV